MSSKGSHGDASQPVGVMAVDRHTVRRCSRRTVASQEPCATRNPRSLRSSWRLSIADPIGLWVLTSGLLVLLCIRIFACAVDCVSPERRLCSHIEISHVLPIVCRRNGACGWTFVCNVSRPHSSLSHCQTLSLVTCQTHFQNHVSTT